MFELLYEIALLTWVLIDKTNRKPSHDTLIFLAICELGVSTSNVFVGFLLCYMIDRITDKPEENFIEPVLARKVPFFVHLSAVKLLNDYLTNASDEPPSPPHNSPTHSKVSSPSLSGDLATRGSLRTERELARIIEAYD